MRDLNQRVAVVTGAASGLGRATAIELAAKGCAVALVDVDADGLAETKAQIGLRTSTHVVDVASEREMRALPAQVLDSHGAVHVLINNAGVNVTASFDEHELADFAWLFGVNFWGVVHGCKFFLPHLRRVDWAHIANVSSLYGLTGAPSQSSYSASKFAVRGFSESLAIELSSTHIGVSCVYPGGVATDIIKNARFAPGDEACREATHRRQQLLMAPKRAARAIVRGIRKNEPRIVIAAPTRAVDLASRLFPGLTAAIHGQLSRAGVL